MLEEYLGGDAGNSQKSPFGIGLVPIVGPGSHDDHFLKDVSSEAPSMRNHTRWPLLKITIVI